MGSRLSGFILKIMGFSIQGNYPKDIKKLVVIAAPHTSYWDFPMGLLIRSKEKVKIKYVGKASLFKPPFGWIMKKLGGVPVDRSKSNNFVDSVIEVFNNKEELVICFAPEGTRKKVESFKSGFYHIAKGAEVPILPILFDFKNKEFRWLDVIYPSGDPEKEIKEIEELFKGVKGYSAEKSYS